MLDDLDRSAQRWAAPVRFLAEGYRWDALDGRDAEWWPQGVTTSADSGVGELFEGRRVVVVAWYAKEVAGAPSRGSRVSFVDVTDPARPRYRHVLLVEPRADKESGAVALEPVRIHVGGIVWLGRSIVAADTRRGLRVFDLDAILRVDGTGHDRHRFVLPQRLAYEAVNEAGAEPFRFSFVSVDRSGPDHQLVVGEFGTGDRSKRMIRLRLERNGGGGDPTALLSLTDGLATPVGVEDGVGHAQGALVVGGRRYASASRGRFRRGSMWTWADGESPREHRAALAIGPEDLSYWPERDEVWSVSEHPGRRYIYAVRRDAFD